MRANAVLVLTDVAAWGIIHAGTGYLAHRLPESLCAHDTWVTRLRGFERGGRLWRLLRVQRWKDRVPEAGDVFAGGVSKRHLPGHSAAGLQQFAAMTRRAEYGHWMCAVSAPVFALWNPGWIAAVMVVYGVAVNAPFIAIQRYNRLRIEGVLGRLAARSRNDRDTTGNNIP